MDATEIQDYARRLLQARGDNAAVEAAQKAAALDQAGDREQARMWRRIEAALMVMRGTRQS